MTDKTELLPMPEKKRLAVRYERSFGSVTAYGHTDDTLRDYARANVAHATAQLQAEIEALRAEAEQHLQQAMRNGAKARRAERLEKALKDIRSLSNSINRDPFALTVLLSDIRHIADTALAERNDNG